VTRFTLPAASLLQVFSLSTNLKSLLRLTKAMIGKKVDLRAARDEAFSLLDVEKIKAYYASTGMPPASSELLLLAEVHKARLYMASIDTQGKTLSRQWLLDNGLTPDISSPPVGAIKPCFLQSLFGRRI